MLGKKVKKIRMQNGFSRNDFCKGIISLSHYSNIENGRYAPSYEVAECLAVRAGVPVEYLLNSSSQSKYLSEVLMDLEKKINNDLDMAYQIINKITKQTPYIYNIQDEFLFNLLRTIYYIRKAKYETAFEIYQNDVMVLYTDAVIHNETNLRLLLKCKGIFLYYKNDFIEAIKSYKSYFGLCEADLEKARTLYNIALSHSKLNEYPDAIHYAKESLKYSFKEHWWFGAGQAYNLLGNSYLFLKDFNKAHYYFNKALNIADEFESKRLRSWVLHNMGILYKRQKNIQKALESFEASTEIKLNLENSNVQITFLSIIDTYLEQKRIDEAKKLLLKLQNQITSERTNKRMNVYEHYIKYIEKDSHDYEKVLKETIQYFKEYDTRLNHDYTKELADYYFSTGKYKLASINYKKIIEVI